MAALVGVILHFFLVLPLMWVVSLGSAVCTAVGLVPGSKTADDGQSELASRVVLEEDQRELQNEWGELSDMDGCDDHARILHILDHMRRTLDDENLLDHLDEATALLKRDARATGSINGSVNGSVHGSVNGSVNGSVDGSDDDLLRRAGGTEAARDGEDARAVRPDATPTYRPAPVFARTSSSREGDDEDDETININEASFVGAQAGAALSWLGSTLWAWMPDVMWAWSTPASVPSAEQRTRILDGVLGSPKVIAVARQMGLSRSERRRRVRAILNTMVAVQNLCVIRIMAYIMKKLWGYLYPFGIHVKEEEIAMLSAYEGSAPFVIVPTHKSHIDYLLFTYLCFARGLPLPHVVAGINLNILFVGPILRWGGAFFIRRSFAGDLLYHAVFDAYVTQLLVAGSSVECFIEGGRSRSGKVLPPKSGFLKVVIDAVADGELDDALVVPVSLNYDRIVENDSHIKELSGNEKHAEQLLGFLSASYTLLYRILSGKLCLGSVDIGIGQPISVRQFLIDSAVKLHHKNAGAASLMAASLTSIAGPENDLDVPVADIVTRARKLASLKSASAVGSPTGSPSDSPPKTPPPSIADFIASADAAGTKAPPAADSESGARTKANRPSIDTLVNVMRESPARSSDHVSGAGPPSSLGVTGLEPSLSNMSAAQAHQLVSTLTAHQRKRITFSLGYSILYACNKSSVVLPAALVGTVLLTHYTRGMRYSDLVRKVKWLREEVNKRGGRIESRDGASLSKSITTVLDRVLQRGGRNRGLVKLHKDIVMLSLYSPKERMELSLYRNQLIHNFVPESLVLCAMYAFEKASGSLVAVQQGNLLLAARFLSNLLKREFIFKPSPGSGHNFAEIVNRLLARGVLLRATDGSLTVNDYDLISKSPAMAFVAAAASRSRSTTHDSGDEGPRGTSMYLFLCALLWPFIDSYWLAALSLYHLYPDRNVSSKDMVNYTQKLGERLYFEGQIDLYEAVSKETVSNALKLFMEKGVIEAVHVENQFTSSPIIRLTKDYHSMDNIDALIANIGVFKKRSRMYRSRRYKAIPTTDIDDAIAIVRRHEGLA